MGIQVAVHARGEILFTGEANLEPNGEKKAGWSLVFEVPAARVSQFQMRRGERVHVALSGEAVRHSALIESFWLDEDAGFSGFSGSGHVRLAGEGPTPV